MFEHYSCLSQVRKKTKFSNKRFKETKFNFLNKNIKGECLYI